MLPPGSASTILHNLVEYDEHYKPRSMIEQTNIHCLMLNL